MKHFRVISLLVLCLAVLATACGSDVPPPASKLDNPRGSGGKGHAGAQTGGGGTDDTDGGGGTSTGGRSGAGGRGGSGGKSGSAGAAGSAGGSDADGGVDGPLVTITSPVAVDDPNGDVIANGKDSVTQNTVVVTCTAKPKEKGASLVDGSSVSLEMLDASDKLVGMPQPGAPSAADPSEYSTKFVFTNVPNGKVSFRCTAKDLAGKSSTDTVSTFVDQGPTITHHEPVANSAHPLLNDLFVSFTVDEAPLLLSGDNGAEVASVSLSINGVAIDALKSKGAGDYRISVSLADSSNGSASVSITAKNARGVTRTDTYFFIVDSKGPDITITSPVRGAIIGGTQALEFTVKDDGSGVKKDSVTVVVNSDEKTFDGSGLWKENMGVYTFSLFSGAITNATVQIVVNIRADDLAGNSSAGTIIYYLDTSKPLVDLDPPPLQEQKKFGTSGATVCSRYFDPLGESAAGPESGVLSDWKTSSDAIVSFTKIRALAWDVANGADDRNQPQKYFSGVARSSVALYVQSDSTKGILIDSSGNGGLCDEIDTTLPVVQLAALDPTGAADYSSGLANPSTGCAAGAEPNKPDKICQGHSDLTRIIQHDQLPGGTAEDVIYAVPDIEGQCPSSQLQLASLQGVKNGWLCLAARAVDKAGNVGVSPPLRACLNAPNNGGTPECAAPASVTPPPCTRDCTAPPHFKNGIYHPDVVILPE
jgi:hypothetical protein